MAFYLLIFLLLLPTIFGNVCVPYNFEQGFEEFDPTLGPVCVNINNNWDISDYNSLSISVEPPHELSETFITSIAPASCVSSFFFDVENGGLVEANVYVLFSELFIISIYNEENQQISSWNSIINAIPENEWTTVRFTVTTLAPFRGYLSMFAQVSINETILIDSFRYIPPDSNADDIECALYRDDDTDDTTDAPTTENGSTTEADDSLPETSTTENGGTTEDGGITGEPTTENGATTDTPNTENGSTTEVDGVTVVSTTENGGTTESDGQTEASTTENGGTTEVDGVTEVPTTENGGTTESNGQTEASTTENGGTTEGDGITEVSTTEAVTSYPDETTTDSNELDTTTNSYTDINNTESNSGEDTTENPDLNEEESSFWNTLTIALVAAGCFLFLVLLCYISYKCGRRKEKKKIPEILFLDIEELPKTIVVPRVKKVYTDSINNSNLYAKDYF